MHVIGAILIYIVGTAIAWVLADSLGVQFQEHVWLIATAVYAGTGVLAGLVGRPDRRESLESLATIAVAVLMAAGVYYVATEYFRYVATEYFRVTRLEHYAMSGPLLGAGPAAAAFVFHLVAGLRGRPDLFDKETCPDDETVKEYVMGHSLLPSKDEVAKLRTRPGGLVCLSGEDHSEDTDDWLWQWLRCKHDPEHVFHAWHYRTLKWRCPVCRYPVYGNSDDPPKSGGS